VLKLSSTGSFGWVSPLVSQTGAGYAWASSLALDGSGNVVAGGVYSGPVDFNPGAGTSTLTTVGGAFITKLNSNGGLTWVQALLKDNTNGSSHVGVDGLVVDGAGNIYATGQFSGTVDFDPGAGTKAKTSVMNAAGTARSYDTYVLKLGAGGSFGWVEAFGGTGTDRGTSLAVDSTGHVHLAGHYQGTVDFDFGPGTHELTTPGDRASFYLVKLSQN
jgi:hypothetical protein